MTGIKPTKVRVNQIQQEPPLWRYEVLEMDGQLIEASDQDYDSEEAARFAGETRAQEIRQEGFLQGTRQ